MQISNLVITYAASQFFGRASAQEMNAAAESAIRNPVRDRIVILPKEELDSL